MRQFTLLALLFLYITIFPVFAQKQISYPLNLPEKVIDAKIFAAENEGKLQAVSLIEKDQIRLYELNKQTSELLERGVASAKMLKGKGFLTNDSISSFYAIEMLDSYVEENFMVYSFQHNTAEELSIKKYPLPEGNDRMYFVAEDAAYALGYTKKGGKLTVHRFRLGENEPEQFTFSVPKELKFKGKHFSHLNYRSSKGLLNPGKLAEKIHLFVEGDRMYFIYEHAGNSVIELLTFDFSSGKVEETKLAPLLLTSEVNFYVHRDELYYYSVNRNGLNIKRYKLVDKGRAPEVLNIRNGDENLPSLVLRNESNFIWAGKEVKEVNANKLIRKLANYDPYIYVHAGNKNGEDLQLVLGSYEVAQNNAPMMMGAGGMMSYGVGMGGSYTIHPYVLIGYNQISGELITLKKPWKNPASVWAGIKSDVRFHGEGKPIAEWIRNLGEEMLIVYFDKKNQSVVVQYEPLFDEKPVVQGTH